MKKDMDTPGIILYPDYEEKFQMLPDEERAALIMAMFVYNRTGVVPEGLSPLVQFALSFIKGDIDRNREKYAETCKRNRENGKKGGRPPKQTEAETENNPVGSEENPAVIAETQSNPEKPKEKYKDKDKDKDKESENEKEKVSPTAGADNTPTHQAGTGIPSLVEVRLFCREMQLAVDPDKFYNYYSSTGWAAVADWQAKLWYWDQQDREKGKTTAAVNRPGYTENEALYQAIFQECGG